MIEIEDKSIKSAFFSRHLQRGSLLALFSLLTLMAFIAIGVATPVKSQSDKVNDPALYLPLLAGNKDGTASATALDPATPLNPTSTDGNVSAAAVNVVPTIELWYGDTQSFGTNGTPQQWVNLLGNITPTVGLNSLESGSTIRLDYELNGIKSSDEINLPKLYLGPGVRRVYGDGDFNLEFDVDDLLTGDNTIIITATNSSGTAVKNVTLNYSSPTPWPLPYTAEWDTISDIEDVGQISQIVDGKWRLEGDGLRTDQLGYDRIIAIGDQTWTEYEAVVPITIHGIDESAYDSPSSVAPGIGLVSRWEGHTNNPAGAAAGCLVAHCGYLPQGANPFYDFESETEGQLYMAGLFEGSTNDDGVDALDPEDRNLAFETPYLWKIRVENIAANETRYSFKLWEASQPEPLRFQMTGVEQTGPSAGQTQGSLLVVAHHVDATIGEVVVTTPAVIPTQQLITNTVGAGDIIVDPIYAEYIQGEAITVTAVPSIGWSFTGWSGDLSGSAAEQALVMNTDKTITANFEEITTATINLGYTGAGTGNIRLDPEQALYNIGDVVMVTALPDRDSQFDGWDGDLFDAELTNPVTLTVQLSNNITAEFGVNINGIVSDDFNSCGLDTSIWTYYPGYVDGPAAPEFTGTDIALLAPAGRYHLNDPDGILTPRIMQAVSNEDFHVEAKLEPFSELTTADQGSPRAGLLVYQDESNFYQYELARIEGVPIIIGYGLKDGVFYGQSFEYEPEVETIRYMNLRREQDSYFLQYSGDGITWYTAPTTFIVLNVSQIGIYTGNESIYEGEELDRQPIDGTEPKNTTVFDYFYNLDALAPGDTATEQYLLTLLRTGDGTVDINPDLPRYGCGQSVSLTPTPAAGSTFTGWGEDLSGSTVPESLTMDQDRTVRATFTSIPTYTLSVTIDSPVANGGTVVLSPDQPAYLEGTSVSLTAIPTVGVAFFGWSGDLTTQAMSETVVMDSDKAVTANFGIAVTATLTLETTGDGYILAEPNQAVYNVGDVVTLTAIPTLGSAFKDWGGEFFGVTENPLRVLIDEDKTIVANFGLNLSGIRSDDFNSCGLSSFWTYSGGYISDPQTPMFSGTQIALMVPGDNEHYISEEEDTVVRISQPAQNADFGVEVKFTSEMSKRYQVRGLYVEDTNGNLLEFQFYHDGDRYNLYVPPVLSGEPILISPASIDRTPTYVRLERLGDNWNIYYSADGLTWSNRLFERAMNVARIGLYGGNTADEGDDFPATPVLVDYFYNTSVLTEGDQPVTQYPLDVDVSGVGSVSVEPPFELFGCNPLVTLTAEPGQGQFLTGWSGDASGSAQTVELVVNGPKAVTAAFDGVPTAELSVGVDGPGSVVVTPTLSAGMTGEYIVGEGVSLQAIPDEGETFLGWRGDLGGRNPMETLIMDVDKAVTATFGIPVSVTLSLNTMGNGQIKVEPELDFYLVGDEITLIAVPDDGAAFSSWVGDLPDEEDIESQNPLTLILDNDVALTAQFGLNTSGIRSDDFNTCQLSPIWTYATGYASDPSTPYMSGTEVALLASKENEYYYDTDGDFLVSLSQPANDVDFDVEIKFGSEMSKAYQSRGLYVEDIFGERLLIEFFHDSQSYQLFTRYRPALIPLLTVDRVPNYVRLSRAEDDWTVSYSEDGERWRSHVFSESMRVTRVGVFAGSEAQNTTIPGHQLDIDYFYNRDALTGGDQPIDQYPVTINTTGLGDVALIPNFDLYGCNQAVKVVADPAYAQVLGSWSGDLFGSSGETQLTVNSAKSIVANFVAAPTYNLTVNTIGSGSVEISPTLTSYLAGELITATATIPEGFEFAGWTGDVFPSVNSAPVMDNPLKFTISRDSLLTATFVDPNAPNTANGLGIFLPFVNGGSPAFQRNSSGAVSGASALQGRSAFRSAPFAPTIDVWHGLNQNVGLTGITQQWVNIQGNVSDIDGIASLVYSLNGGAETALNIGPGERRIADIGDFNIQIDHDLLNQGANTVLITAMNNFNQATTETVTLNYDGTSGQSLPYNVDWSTVTNLNDVAHVMDGKWEATAEGLRPLQIGYDRVIAIGDMSWTDYEVEVPITIHGIDATAFDKPKSVAPSLGIIMRWQGHTFDPPDSNVGCLMTHCGWLPQGSNPNYSFKRQNGTVSAELLLSGGGESTDSLLDPQDRELTFGTTYIWKARIEDLPSGQVRHSFKLWEDGEAEPALYQMVLEETPTIDSGSLLLLAHHIDVTFGNVTVTTPEVIETATLAISSQGNGSITPSPNQTTYVVGQDVTLTASPSVGWEFQNWSGALSGSDNPITFEVTGDANIIGIFSQITTASITRTVTGNGSIKVEPDLPVYNIGDTITVTAVSQAGAQFASWGGDFIDEIDNPVVLVVDRDYAIEAAFETNVSGILSDDFNSCALESFWRYEPGLDDVPTSPAFSGTSLALTAPGGIEHYAEESVRLTQPANDVDFVVETKFKSDMDTAYQTRGLVVEDTFGGLIRFEFFQDGAAYNLFIADENNSPYVPSQAIGLVPTYVRLQRDGSTWNLFFSSTGASDDWDVRSFNHDFEVSRVGLLAANSAPDEAPFPTHFVNVDYFYNRQALPAGDSTTNQYSLEIRSGGGGTVDVSPDFQSFGCAQTVTLTAVPDSGKGLIAWGGDATGAASQVSLLVDSPKLVTATFDDLEMATLSTNQIGEGTIVVSPSVSSLVVGQTVTVEAFPANGWRFDGWSGDLSGQTNPTTLLVDNDKQVMALFSEVLTVQISTVVTGSGSILILPALSEYPIGETITVTAVANGDGQFGAWEGDLFGQTQNPVIMTVTDELELAAIFDANESGIRSDDFNQCGLASFWNYEQGLASAPAQPSISGYNLALAVPEGVEFYAEDAVRVMQAVNDVDFAVEAKFDSAMTAGYQTRGFVIENAAGENLRFEFFYDGATYNLFIAPDGNPNGILFAPDIEEPTYIRLQREGSNWTVSHSENGTEDSWLSHNVGYNFSMKRLGLFAGNTGDENGPFPAHTAVVDYFYNLDAIGGGDTQSIEHYSLIIDTEGNGDVLATPTLPTYGCNQPVMLTAFAGGNASLSQWSGDLDPTTNSGATSITIQMDGNKAVMAQFGQGKVYLPLTRH